MHTYRSVTQCLIHIVACVRLYMCQGDVKENFTNDIPVELCVLQVPMALHKKVLVVFPEVLERS